MEDFVPLSGGGGVSRRRGSRNKLTLASTVDNKVCACVGLWEVAEYRNLSASCPRERECPVMKIIKKFVLTQRSLARKIKVQ